MAWLPPGPDCSAAAPIESPLAVSTIVPVGAPEPGATAATLTVNAMFWPSLDGDGVAITEVTVSALVTSWVSESEPFS